MLARLVRDVKVNTNMTQLHEYNTQCHGALSVTRVSVTHETCGPRPGLPPISRAEAKKTDLLEKLSPVSPGGYKWRRDPMSKEV